MGWEDDLIAELEQEQVQRSRMPTMTGGDPLQLAFEELTRTVEGSVRRIGEALSYTVVQRGSVDDGRVRWMHGSRTLSIWLDSAAGKTFVSVDLGREAALEELSMSSGLLVDSKQRPIEPDELAHRFVGLLFRGR